MDPVLKNQWPRLFVVGAVLSRERDGVPEILAFRRHRADSSGGKWEFPGGKIEPGESPEAAIHRELSEELGVEVEVDLNLRPVIGTGIGPHRYATREIDLTLFWVRPLSWKFSLPEHEGMIWVDEKQAARLDWLAADVPWLAPLFAFLSSAEARRKS